MTPGLKTRPVHAFARSIAVRAIRLGLSLPGRSLEAFSEYALLRDVVRDLGINVVLDVGANVGQFAHALRGIGFAGRIISFEPVGRDFAALRLRMRNDPLWKGVQVALGDDDRTAAINVVPRLTVMNSLLAPVNAAEDLECEMVQVRRLDGMLADLLSDVADPICLLKMDTQGYDLKCFAGAAGSLAQVAALFSELSVQPIYRDCPHYLEALAVYEAAGFELLNLSVVSRRAGAIQEMNCLMRRAG